MGPKAVPGLYQVRLTVDGKAQIQALKVVMDPRSPAAAEVLAQQFQLAKQIFGETMEARRTLAEIGSVQKQISDLRVKLTPQDSPLKVELSDVQSGIEKILKNKKNATEGPGLQDAYTALATALRVVEGGDRAAPSQAVAVYEESSRQVKARIAEWTRFKQTRVEQLNQQLRASKVGPLAIAD
jgi:hypothetical protein